jgi:hypothetical protein
MPDETEMAKEAVRLLTRYIDIANAYGGDDSLPAQKFLHDHANNPQFVQLVAETRNVRPQLRVGG